MAGIQSLVPPGLSLRFKQLFDVFEELLEDRMKEPKEIIENIYNRDYSLPPEVVDLLLQLFNFYLSDLSFFNTDKVRSIKNNFADNIFTFYRNRVRKEIYKQLLYIYGLKGNVYVLDTFNWQEFIRASTAFLDINRFTDIGLTTDAGVTTDNTFRTPFIEIEILLEKLYDGKLWSKDSDSAFKKDVENIHFILSKVFYTLRLEVEFRENETVTLDNGIVVKAGAISDPGAISRYSLLFVDGTEESFDIYRSVDLRWNSAAVLLNKWNVDRTIIGIKLFRYNSKVCISVIIPELYSEKNDRAILLLNNKLMY